MDIKPKIVSSSFYSRQLKMVPELENFINQVKDYKAIHKFHELFYDKAEKGHNKYFQELRKTDFRYYFNDRSWCIDFIFQPANDNNNSYQLCFKVEEKTIPGIIEGLNKYKEQLNKWVSEENNFFIDSDYDFSKFIDRKFNDQEFTKLQFENKRLAVINYLKEQVKQLENFDINNPNYSGV